MNNEKKANTVDFLRFFTWWNRFLSSWWTISITDAETNSLLHSSLDCHQGKPGVPRSLPLAVERELKPWVSEWTKRLGQELETNKGTKLGGGEPGKQRVIEGKVLVLPEITRARKYVVGPNEQWIKCSPLATPWNYLWQSPLGHLVTNFQNCSIFKKLNIWLIRILNKHMSNISFNSLMNENAKEMVKKRLKHHSEEWLFLGILKKRNVRVESLAWYKNKLIFYQTENE